MSFKAARVAFVGCILAAPLVTGLVFAWLFSRDGTLGLYLWMPQFRTIFIALGILAVVGPALALAAYLVKRARRVLSVLAVVFAVIGSLGPLAAAGAYARDASELSPSTPPLLLVTGLAGAQGVSDLALVFRTDRETTNTVDYGVTTLSQQVAEAVATREHVLLLKDLAPNTRYQWRLNDGAVCSFLTPATEPAADVLYHFGVSGDAHFGTGLSASEGGDPNVARGILAYAADSRNGFNTFFVVGDAVNLGSTNEDWQIALETFAPFSCGVPLRPVMGNHDAIINGETHYRVYLFPDEMAAPDGSWRYQRIDAGRVHLFMLHVLWGMESFSAEQRAWLARQMASIPADDWKVVMMHSMVYSSGSVFEGYPWYDPVEMVREFAPLMEHYGVDLVISGHNHHLEFLQKNGVNYAIVGGLGGKPDPNATHQSVASVWYMPQQYGFLDVVVRPDSLALTFRNPAGDELKAFTVDKQR